MVSVDFGRRSDDSGVSAPRSARLNVVAVAILAAAVAVGVRRPGSRPASWVLPVVVSARRPRADAVAAHRAAVGARRRAAARPLRRPARPRPLLDRAVRRSRVVVDRPADHHHELRRRADADLRHRAGQRRRGAVLDGARRARRPRSKCRTTRRRSAGRRRRRCATSSAGPRSTDLLRGREQIEAELQQLIDQRSNPWGVTVSSVEMRDIVIPGRAAGRDVARSAGGPREAGAHHPRPGRDGDRPLVRGSGEVVPTTTRRRCTCAR